MSTRRSVSHSRSSCGVSGGVGFGLCQVLHALPRRLVQIEQRLSVIRHKRIDVDHLRDAVARAVGDAGGNHAAIAVADQHDTAQIFVLDDVEGVLDVRLKIDRRMRQMRALAQTRVARRHEAMPGCLHQRVHLFPCPSGRPGTVTDEQGCSHDFSPLVIATGTP